MGDNSSMQALLGLGEGIIDGRARTLTEVSIRFTYGWVCSSMAT